VLGYQDDILKDADDVKTATGDGNAQ